MATGMELIAIERRRQVEAEGYDATHDDEHGPALLADAAYCYRDAEHGSVVPPRQWPWGASAWKPKDRRCNLVRAGALYLAAADTAERRGDFDTRNQMRDHGNSCAVLLDSILTGG